MTTSTADPAQPTVSTVVVAADGSVTVTQVSNATTVTYPGIVDTGFSPINLSPTLWLDASDGTTITESGGAVSQWDDKSGNGNDLTQGTSANQPTTGSRTLNGFNVLDFDGTDNMAVTYAAPISQPLTIFGIAQNDNPSGNGHLWTGTVANSAQLYLVGSVAEHWITGGLPTLKYTTAPDGNVNLYRVTYDGASTSFAINGDVKITGTTGTDSPAGFKVGSAVNGLAAFDGVVGELIVVEGTLTAQQIADTETYLADKWGITL